MSNHSACHHAVVLGPSSPTTATHKQLGNNSSLYLPDESSIGTSLLMMLFRPFPSVDVNRCWLSGMIVGAATLLADILSQRRCCWLQKKARGLRERKMATTSSLVSDIVKKSSAASSKQLEQYIQDVKSKASQVQDELSDFVQQNYEEFKRFYSNILEISDQVEQVQRDFAKLSTQIEEETMVKLLESSGKRKELSQKLEGVNQLVKVVSALSRVCVVLEDFHSLVKGGSLKEASQGVKDAWQVMSSLETLVPSARILSSLTSELTECTAELHTHLAGELGKVFAWSASPVMSLTAEEAGSVSLMLSGPSSPAVFDALSVLEKVKGHGTSLGSLINTRFVTPLVNLPQLKVVVKSDDTHRAILSVAVCSSPRIKRAHFLSVLEDVVVIFQQVLQVVPPVHREEWAREVGLTVVPHIYDSAVKQLLTRLLPTSHKQLEDYLQLMVPTQQFEKRLVALGVAESGYCKLSLYVSQAESHFTAKQILEVLGRGRALLKQPLLASQQGRLFKITYETQQSTEAAVCSLDALKSAFPECLISSSVKEFVELVVSTLSTAPAGDSQAVVTARRLVDLFLAVMPAAHGTLVKHNTRAATIFHNNCLYVADQLIHIGLRLHQQGGAPCRTFVDLIPVVRHMGEKVFLEAMLREKEGILECLKRSPGLAHCASEENQAAISKCLQQALTLTSEFSTTSEGTLPPTILIKSMGSLVDVTVAWLAEGVLELEDISADEADVQHGFATFVLGQGPGLVGVSRQDLPSYAAHWVKLEEVAFVLQANLQQITAFWCGQKAKVLTASDIRGMIRALFQNTDKRAAALAKIK